MKFLKFILVISAFLLAGLAYGQRGDEKPGKDEINKLMKQKLMERLSLDESSADKFLSVSKENNQAIRKLNKERKDIMESIELDPSAADIDTKLDRIIDLESQIVEQKRTYFKELRTFLSPQQVAKTLLLKRRFDKELRKEINKKRKSSND